MTAHSPLTQPLAKLTSLTYDELEIGQSASITRPLTLTDVNLFATMSGNVDPLHFPEGVDNAIFSQPVGHGMWAGSLFSGLLGTQLPGPGTVYHKQSLKFKAPIPLGAMVTATITVEKKKITGNGQKLVTLDCCLCDQKDKVLVKGTAVVVPPSQHRDQEGHVLPELQFIAHDQLDMLTAKCASLAPLPTAIVFPCDSTSLQGACDGARLGLIDPVLVGPEERIRALAEEHGLDISPFRLVDAMHEKDAAAKGVALAKKGEVGAVMKGSLHTDELMGAVVKRDIGLRTKNRISHVFVMSVPTYPKPLLITDAVVNITPSADDKAHIINNAVGLANVLGVETPKVAILSAVEQVNLKIASTVDAAILCKMADRDQIKGRDSRRSAGL
ncbi:bifunctional enoyl-CoA hydratase/phosphate acetyltransferase [uncultured Cohaesibacter sp.]|uniref:bifunctional enoyl-CoA hydratase/phosphate acetyltransferase n=1 Tax=uncultured Cohaesibacter sp. TaxID=1002546 RepID=UPI00292CF97A|nr:bifunctional enoyl-CoA hydratase/phosphate acetyltransferase [uncultured Cohaesibacter sp.]